LSLFAAAPDKRYTERFTLLYSPVWMAVVGVVMLTGVFRGWGERGLMLLGVGMAAPLFAMPFFGGERDRPLLERHAFRFVWLITLFAFLQCYFGSPLFFRLFGMRYHFNSRILWNGTPLFLYFMTVAYFATYHAVDVVLWRAFRTRQRRPGPLAVLGVRALLAYATAFAETAAMATEGMRDAFSYRDPRFVMLWGSIAYGSLFFVTLPLFYDLDEDERLPRRSFADVTLRLLALNMICLVVYEIMEWALRPIAP
jgi:cycloeucalenol cycloisomerase